jgi:hypothetical protein
LNPGSPAPQASVLIHTRLRAHRTGLIPSEDVKGKIINTLVKLKNSGLEEQTVKIVGFYLRHIAENVSLDSAEKVKEFIANKPVGNGFKGNLVKAYNYYCLVNNVVWDRPKYKWEQNKPKIPTEETLNKIITSCGWKYTVVFTLLKETGAMPKELSCVSLRDIDFERETITLRGRKGHHSRTIKLRPSVVAMLKTYLVRIGNKEPIFPTSKQMTKAWIKYRKRLAERLNEHELNTIRLYDLRHFKASMTYYKTKDVLFTKEVMGWKKLETALFYLQNLSFGSDEFHVCVARSLEEACRLVEQGFEYVTEVDGAKIFRKRK